MLAIGRALMADPKLLILDEPSCGLQPSLVSDLFHRLKEIKEKISLLIAEQNVRQCLKAIDRGYVIENGRIVMEKGAQDLAGNDHIRRSYLGFDSMEVSMTLDRYPTSGIWFLGSWIISLAILWSSDAQSKGQRRNSQPGRLHPQGLP